MGDLTDRLGDACAGAHVDRPYDPSMSNNEKDRDAQAALLESIKTAAAKTTHPATLRTLAEAYALATGSLNGVQHVEVKSG